MKNLTIISLFFLSFISFAQTQSKAKPICQKCGSTHILSEGGGVARQKPRTYPTVAKEFVTVEVNKNDNPCQYNFTGNVVGYQIINQFGTTVFTAIVNPTDIFTIDTNNLPKGTYFIQLQYDIAVDNEQVSMEKFIKD